MLLQDGGSRVRFPMGSLQFLADIFLPAVPGIFPGGPEGWRPLGRPRHRRVDNIRMDLQEVGCGNMDWIGLTQDRDMWRILVSGVMNLRVP